MAEERPPLTFACHDGVAVPPDAVRKILLKDVGLSYEEALELVMYEGGVYHSDGDSWWAESADAPGFTAVASSLDDVRALVRSGREFDIESAENDVRELLPSGAPVSVPPVTP